MNTLELFLEKIKNTLDIVFFFNTTLDMVLETIFFND